jgi:hypothetical protein
MWTTDRPGMRAPWDPREPSGRIHLDHPKTRKGTGPPFDCFCEEQERPPRNRRLSNQMITWLSLEPSPGRHLVIFMHASAR